MRDILIRESARSHHAPLHARKTGLLQLNKMAKSTTTPDAVSTSVKKAADVVKDKVDETASKVSEKVSEQLKEATSPQESGEETK